MFSDTWYKADKYNLNTFEYISTYERMPWRFTSLVDPQYLPNLDPLVSSKLNKLFKFRYSHSTEVIHDNNKFLSIEYVDNDIKSFFCFNSMKYHTLTHIPGVWKRFINITGLEDLNHCKQKIDKMTDQTDVMETDVIGIHFDKNANYSGIRIYDPTYNLAEYSSNETLNSINLVCRENKKDIMGNINIFHNTNLLHYTLKVNIPQTILVREDKDYFKISSDVKERKELILNTLLRQNFITQNQKEFISNICLNKSVFSIDYVVSENGELIDMYLRHLKVLNFEDLTLT